MIMARHGQCVVITPFTLMGAMAPITLAGALVQQTAEALGIIALCQLLRPGAPCVHRRLHLQRRHAHRFAGLRHAGICARGARHGADRPPAEAFPVRTSAVNASPGGRRAVDLRDRVLAAGRDPEPQPPDQPRRRLARRRPVGVAGKDRRRRRDAARLGRDPEAGRRSATTISPSTRSRAFEPGGHFFGSAHTLARYETAFYRPLLSDWSNFENWQRGRCAECDATRHRHLEEVAGRVCRRRRSIPRSRRRSTRLSRAGRTRLTPVGRSDASSHDHGS